MLIEFTVGNFRSFCEPVTLSMVAANISEKNKLLEKNNIAQLDNIKLLKSAAVYGANASGKSNLVAAFAFMRYFVLTSTGTNSREFINTEPFLLNLSSSQLPSYFEVTFQVDDTRFRYGFEVFKQKVHSEWLYRTKKRESELFWRDNNTIEVRTGFREGRNLESRTKENTLFLSVADQWNGEVSHKIISWFKSISIISGIHDKSYMDFSKKKFNDDNQMQENIRQYMRKMDVGISDITSTQNRESLNEINRLIAEVGDDSLSVQTKQAIENGTYLVTVSVNMVRNKYDDSGNPIEQVHFDFETQESEGTKKAFALSGPILQTLQNGDVLFVDELDARLHPLMTKHIIKLFNSTANNPNNAQLIFITHDTNLLNKDLLRRDQIWFTEKDRYGATDLYSLVEYKGVRNDASYESDYIAGKYGAIPYIGSISHLIGDENVQT